VRNGTTSAASSAVTLTNSSASVGGSVSGGTATICQGSSTGTMTLSGQTGSVVRWERRLNSGTWTSIASTATTYSETPSSAGTWQYRAVVRSGTCAEAFSAARSITVQASSLGGSIAAASSTICLNASTGTMTLSGHRGSVLRWERRHNGGTWTNLTTTATTYSETLSASGTWEYRALVQNSPCTSVYSATRSITVGTQPLGYSCTCARPVTLPLLNYQDHTGNYGNDIRPAHVSPSFTGLEANDAVFTFTLAQASTLTTTLQVSGIWGAVTILRLCPNATTPPTPVATFAQWNGGQFNTSLSAGTYLLVVSSTSIWTSTMPFTLSIEATTNALSSHTLRSMPIGGDDNARSNSSSSPIVLFPNPAQNVLNVQAETPLHSLRIINTQGIVVYQQESIDNTQFACPLGDLPAGIYFLQTLDEAGNMQSRNFIIQR